MPCCCCDHTPPHLQEMPVACACGWLTAVAAQTGRPPHCCRRRQRRRWVPAIHIRRTHVWEEMREDQLFKLVWSRPGLASCWCLMDKDSGGGLGAQGCCPAMALSLCQHTSSPEA